MQCLGNYSRGAGWDEHYFFKIKFFNALGVFIFAQHLLHVVSPYILCTLVLYSPMLFSCVLLISSATLIQSYLGLLYIICSVIVEDKVMS